MKQYARMQSMVLSGAAAACLCACSATALAQSEADATRPELSILDPAPQIDIGYWVKGDEVKELKEGQIYVLEFWATWCGPCKANMPHLSEMAQHHAENGVTTIGVSDEKLQTVVKFLCEADDEGVLWNDKMQYTVATDPDLSVKTDYMKAANQRGIPCAFIIGKDLTIQWIGHPYVMEDVLNAVVDGTWDAAPYKEEFEANYRKSLKRDKISQKLNTARADKDWQTVLTVLNEMAELEPERASMYAQQKFQIMVRDMGDVENGYAFGRTLVKENWDNSGALNAIAWWVVDDKGLTDAQRDYDFALKAAKRACELTEYKNAMILDTLACVHYRMGDLESALKWQRQAVEVSEPGAMADDIKKTLEKYELEAGGDKG